MAIGDITIYEPSASQLNGAKKANVAAGATKINPGEPVAQALGGVTVTAMATNKPVVGTDFLVGIATSTSTQTASVAGTVDYLPLQGGLTYLMTPNAPTSWNTQAGYDALVGKRVLIDLTTGSYTILASDGATSGCVVMPLDISKYPGRVAFTFRIAVNTFA
jgi:hypothetical protein